jgi:hypothetical protein
LPEVTVSSSSSEPTQLLHDVVVLSMPVAGVHVVMKRVGKGVHDCTRSPPPTLNDPALQGSQVFPSKNWPAAQATVLSLQLTV